MRVPSSFLAVGTALMLFVGSAHAQEQPAPAREQPAPAQEQPAPAKPKTASERLDDFEDDDVPDDDAASDAAVESTTVPDDDDDDDDDVQSTVVLRPGRSLVAIGLHVPQAISGDDTEVGGLAGLRARLAHGFAGGTELSVRFLTSAWRSDDVRAAELSSWGGFMVDVRSELIRNLVLAGGVGHGARGFLSMSEVAPPIFTSERAFGAEGSLIYGHALPHRMHVTTSIALQLQAESATDGMDVEGLRTATASASLDWATTDRLGLGLSYSLRTGAQFSLAPGRGATAPALVHARYRIGTVTSALTVGLASTLADEGAFYEGPLQSIVAGFAVEYAYDD